MSRNKQERLLKSSRLSRCQRASREREKALAEAAPAGESAMIARTESCSNMSHADAPRRETRVRVSRYSQERAATDRWTSWPISAHFLLRADVARNHFNTFSIFPKIDAGRMSETPPLTLADDRGWSSSLVARGRGRNPKVKIAARSPPEIAYGGSVGDETRLRQILTNIVGMQPSLRRRAMSGWMQDLTDGRLCLRDRRRYRPGFLATRMDHYIHGFLPGRTPRITRRFGGLGPRLSISGGWPAFAGTATRACQRKKGGGECDPYPAVYPGPGAQARVEAPDLVDGRRAPSAAASWVVDRCSRWKPGPSSPSGCGRPGTR